jgi:MSHA biogenesis protein MshJ
MSLPAGLEKVFAQFNRLSLRERALLAAAGLVAIVMAWTLATLDPLSAKQSSLREELTTLEKSIAGTATAMQTAAADDPGSRAAEQEKQLQQQLEQANRQLASKSAGVIPPEMMVRVIHDVLTNQRGITLVSLQNKPVTTLLEPTAGATMTATAGPYVHRVELVIDGSYLDILSYLKALEALPWRFYWRGLELQTTSYPVNRVRIELSTLSLDKEWIGV